jgi:protein phosphatase PTC7
MFLATRSLAATDICTARSTLVQIISISSSRDHALRYTTRPLRLNRHFSSSSSSHSTSSSRISYRVAGSCSAKGRRFNPEKHTYNFDPTIHEAIGIALDNIGEGRSRQNRPASGEDAFFASRVGAEDTGAIAFAVADGVGGWAEHKIDPADVSHGLCTYMAQHALTEEASLRKLRPKELLQKGYNSVVADESITAGGTTASVGVAQTDGSVELAKYVLFSLRLE